MKNAEAIALIGVEIGLPDIRLDVNDTCNLVIDERLEIYLTGDANAEELRLIGVLGDLADFNIDPIALLASNANAVETGRGALAIDRVTDEVLYVRTINTGSMDSTELMAELRDFIKYTVFWESLLPDMQVSTVATVTGSDEDVMLRI